MLNNFDAQSSQDVQPQTPVTASIFERAVAFIIDILLLFLIASTSFTLFFPASWAFSDTKSVMYGVLSLMVMVLYFTVLTFNGHQTLGKWLLGIKVIDRTTKQNLSFTKSFVRALGYVFNFMTALIGFAFVFFSRKRLALEDLISGSEVVTVRPKTDTEIVLISALGTIVVILVAIYSYSSSVFSISKNLISAAEEQLTSVAYLEEVHKKHFGNYTDDILRLSLLSGDAVQFQRDMQKSLRPGGFQIGVSKDGYYITGFAKDKKATQVFFTK